jgi:hypothetical protein
MKGIEPGEARAHGDHVAMAGQLVNIVVDYLHTPAGSPQEDQAQARLRNYLDLLGALGLGTVESVAFCLATMIAHAADQGKLQAYVNDEFEACKRAMREAQDSDG